MHSGQFANTGNVGSFQEDIFGLEKVLSQVNDIKLHHPALCFLHYETDR